MAAVIMCPLHLQRDFMTLIFNTDEKFRDVMNRTLQVTCSCSNNGCYSTIQSICNDDLFPGISFSNI